MTAVVAQDDMQDLRERLTRLEERQRHSTELQEECARSQEKTATSLSDMDMRLTTIESRIDTYIGVWKFILTKLIPFAGLGTGLWTGLS